MTHGFILMIRGYFLKMAIADSTAVFVHNVYNNCAAMGQAELIKVNNYLQRTCPSIPQLDLNTRWEDLNFGYSDLLNEGDLNGAGAQEGTPYVADFIADSLRKTIN